MNTCIFCKIIAGELRSYKVYEDNEFMGFLDIRPLSRGHTLVVPKKHYQWVSQVPNFGHYWEVAGKIGNCLQSSLNAEFIIFLTWGLEIPHAHIHVIPKYKGDNMKGIDWDKHASFEQREMELIAGKIKEGRCF